MSIQPYNNTTPPPGWYPDPEGGPALRWFNGTDWTYQYQAPTQQFAPPPPAERRFTIHYGFALLALFSLGATLLFGIPMLATASDPDTQGVGAVMGVLWMLWGGMRTLIWTAFAIQHTLKARRT
jgi:hypothetical protein